MSDPHSFRPPLIDGHDATTAARDDSLLDLEFSHDDASVLRTVRAAMGSSRSFLDLPNEFRDLPPDKAWFLARLRGARPRRESKPRSRVRIVDLFSGAGGLALGASWAIEALGGRSMPSLAVDVESDALDVHDYNHVSNKTWVGSVRDLFTPTELLAAHDPRGVARKHVLASGADWLTSLGRTDLLLGGPPCQGHSNLNNRTRRTDQRNQLYFWMALAAHALQPKIVVVENVASVKTDAGDVVGSTIGMFGRLGYDVVFDDVLAADRMGVAQTRRRHFLIVVRRDVVGPHACEASQWLLGRNVPTSALLEAIGDLADAAGETDYDSPSDLSTENKRRIDYLFDEDIYELPDTERPDSHKDGHTYPSVYGRMHGDRPAGTLSTGFLTPGRGRYVHPTRRRTMTLHEAARVQGFPDDFRFIGASGTVPRRTSIARMIGDAVPPPMAFHVVLAALGSLKEDAFVA